MKKKKEKTFFNATLVTNKGLLVKDVFANNPEEVIPYLTRRYGLKEVTHCVISVGENIYKQNAWPSSSMFDLKRLRCFNFLCEEN